MREIIHRASLTVIALLVLLTCTAAAHAAACYATPKQAATPTLLHVEQVSSNLGYRLEGMRWDPLLEQRWAIVSSCGRPDLPPQMIQLNNPFPAASNGSASLFPAVIHAGDVVHVIGQEEFVRIEFTGVAEESGPLGARVRIHLLRSKAQQMADAANGSLFAVVRGTREVEIVR